MAFVPKSVFRALDQLDCALTEVENDEDIKHNDINLALAISGLIVLLKKIRGEEIDDAMKEYEKCTRAQDRLTAPASAPKEEKPQEATTNKKQKVQQKKQPHRLSLSTSSTSKRTKM